MYHDISRPLTIEISSFIQGLWPSTLFFQPSAKASGLNTVGEKTIFMI